MTTACSRRCCYADRRHPHYLLTKRIRKTKTIADGPCPTAAHCGALGGARIGATQDRRRYGGSTPPSSTVPRRDTLPRSHARGGFDASFGEAEDCSSGARALSHARGPDQSKGLCPQKKPPSGVRRQPTGTDGGLTNHDNLTVTRDCHAHTSTANAGACAAPAKRGGDNTHAGASRTVLSRQMSRVRHPQGAPRADRARRLGHRRQRVRQLERHPHAPVHVRQDVDASLYWAVRGGQPRWISYSPPSVSAASGS